MALDDPRGDDPDHAGMPPLARQHQPRRLANLIRQLPPRGLRRRIDLPLSSPALGVHPVQLNRNLLRPRLVLGEKKLNPCVGPIEPPRSIDPRRQPEREIPLVQLGRLAFRNLQQCPNPGPTRPTNLLEALPDQCPILADEWNDIGDGGQGNQIQVRLPFAESTRKLPSDRRPTKSLERIPVNPRMQDRAVGQLRPRLVVVGDDHVHATRLGLRHLVDGGDSAIDRDQQPGAATGEKFDVGG
jgi:hypothetical protein